MMVMLTIACLFDAESWDLTPLRQALPEAELVTCPDCRNWSPAEYAERCRGFDAVIATRSTPPLPEELVGQRGRLRLYAYCHGSVKHYVAKALIDDGLLVSNWGDQVAGVAESALCLVLACLKQLKNLDRFIRADWSNDRRVFSDFPATLEGRDVGLYGFGPIGRHMARMLVPLGPRIAIYDPYATEVPDGIRRCASLEELFATCQVISIHCGLNDQTTGSVDARLLALLPQGGVLVNTARGPIVVEEDLAAALSAGRLVAGVDVITDERAWATSPLVATDAYLTGHVLGSARRKNPDAPPRPTTLPDHVLHNLVTLARGHDDYVNLITSEIYDLKT